MTENLTRRARLALATLLFGLVRTQPFRGNPFQALGPEPRVLVVRQQNQMGDMLLATPCLRALRECLPGSWITLLASDENAAVVRNNPYVNEVLVYSKKLFRTKPLALIEFISTLRRRRFDVALVLSTVSLSVTNAILCMLSGARYRVTYSGESFGLGFVDRAFHVAVPIPDASIHQSRLGLGLLEHFGITTRDLSPIMVPSDDDDEFAKEFVSRLRYGNGAQSGFDAAGGSTSEEGSAPQESRRAETGIHVQVAEGGRAKLALMPPKSLVAIHSGAGKTKNRWPAARFAGVARALNTDHGSKIIVMAGPADAEVLNEILGNLDFEPVLLTGQTIGRVAAVMKRLDLLICNDTGVLHVAASVGCPTLALFGPTDAARWAPLSTRVRALRAPGADLRQLEEKEVLALALEMLSGKGGTRAD